eukprot:130892-Chlamydomonas_euryale.AAC.3
MRRPGSLLAALCIHDGGIGRESCVAAAADVAAADLMPSSRGYGGGTRAHGPLAALVLMLPLLPLLSLLSLHAVLAYGTLRSIVWRWCLLPRRRHHVQVSARQHGSTVGCSPAAGRSVCCLCTHQVPTLLRAADADAAIAVAASNVKAPRRRRGRRRGVHASIHIRRCRRRCCRHRCCGGRYGCWGGLCSSCQGMRLRRPSRRHVAAAELPQQLRGVHPATAAAPAPSPAAHARRRGGSRRAELRVRAGRQTHLQAGSTACVSRLQFDVAAAAVGMYVGSQPSPPCVAP